MRAPSILEILKPAVDPSSSHTLGPLLAARDFVSLLRKGNLGGDRIRVTLYGSLARTGRGHLTDAAISARLSGLGVAELRITSLHDTFVAVKQCGTIRAGKTTLAFQPERDIVFDPETEVDHPNRMRFELLSALGRPILSTVYLSVGGGRLVGGSWPVDSAEGSEFPPISMNGIVSACEQQGRSLVQYVLDTENATYGHTPTRVMQHAREMWCIMRAPRRRAESRGGLAAVSDLDRDGVPDRR